MINTFLSLVINVLVWMIAIGLKIALKNKDSKSVGGKIRDFCYLNLPYGCFIITSNELFI